MKDPRDAPLGSDLNDSTRLQKGANPNEPGHPNKPGSVSSEHDPLQSNMLRVGIGVLLFLAWIAATIVWVASTVHESVAKGSVMPAVAAASALALLVLLGSMEGLEVSVIDRWQELWPGRPTSYLAGWLAARQLFVALIVTSATLLANRSVLVVPGLSGQITDAFTLGVFDLAWVTLTVLWFAQILPKHLGAMNPDRYIRYLRRTLFPVVSFVHRVGVSQPGEWTASYIEYRVDWPARPHDARTRSPGQSLAAIWSELRPPSRRQAHDEDQDRPKAA